ncbi:rhomboid family protein [Rhodovulum imhoffii]|uniref:Rhomboid family protein n=1 Tax=Rhodovulum imhoffii TaxID=365340 RepID=A0A2T5BP04_9RHOB|nr:rhomboid family intramembrane serine protease [Rhodovulum imhoffii]MBK5933635.1 rhomboid family intramembrane serine protease [Rhodovulum imhoffii]PTN00719.1 rhomboid family protein [Rhodovulum imhoffii]
MSDPNAPPLNPLPSVVWLLALPVIAMEIVLGAGAQGLIGGPEAVGWRMRAMEQFAFSPRVMHWMLGTGQFPPGHMARIVTYPFVHASFTHALFALVFLLALGKMVGEIFRAWAVALIFFGSAIMGALVYGVLLPQAAPLVGGYPAVYGLIGAFSFLMWVRLGRTGANQYRAFSLIAMLLGIQLLFGLLFGGPPDWVADLAGFVTGFVLSLLVGPGSWGRVLAKLRQR